MRSLWDRLLKMHSAFVQQLYLFVKGLYEVDEIFATAQLPWLQSKG